MTHFSVTARISGDHVEDASSVLEEMMEPYYECSEDPRYRVFVDQEDEMRKKYETESTEYVQLEGGALVLPWELEARRVVSPTMVSVPFRDKYETFEKFAEGWYGIEEKGPSGRYGYYCNPNGKWDWYEIGGRWSGFFPTKSGESRDVVLASEIDWDAVEKTRVERRDKFYLSYSSLMRGAEDAFGVGRSRAIDIGLLRVENGPVDPVDGEIVVPWSSYNINDDRRTWHDVFKLISPSELESVYGWCFNPLVTFAAVDANGWHAPGNMGMFAYTDASPENRNNWARDFTKQLYSDTGTTTLVLVDCHT